MFENPQTGQMNKLKMFRKNPFRTTYSSFSSKVQNLTVFSVTYMIRIRFYGPGEIISKEFRAARQKFAVMMIDTVIEVQIPSLFEDNTASWVRIVNGVDKYVTESMLTKEEEGNSFRRNPSPKRDQDRSPQ